MSDYTKVKNLKAASQMYNFLNDNKITDMAELDEFVKNMYRRNQAIRDELKPIERRLPVLNEHLKQAGYYKEFSDIYKKYKQLKPTQQVNFKEKHRRKITLYETADGYLKQHLNGRDKVPLPTWQADFL